MSGSRVFMLVSLAALAAAIEVGVSFFGEHANCSLESCNSYIWAAVIPLAILPFLGGILMGPWLESRRARLLVAISTSGAALLTIVALSILEALDPQTSDQSRSDLLASALGFWSDQSATRPPRVRVCCSW